MSWGWPSPTDNKKLQLSQSYSHKKIHSSHSSDEFWSVLFLRPVFIETWSSPWLEHNLVRPWSRQPQLSHDQTPDPLKVCEIIGVHCFSFLTHVWKHLHSNRKVIHNGSNIQHKRMPSLQKSDCVGPMVSKVLMIFYCFLLYLPPLLRSMHRLDSHLL